MEQDILKKLEEQKIRLDKVYTSVEKTRKYFLWTLIISVAAVVLPFIALIAIIPSFLSTYSSLGGF